MLQFSCINNFPYCFAAGMALEDFKVFPLKIKTENENGHLGNSQTDEIASLIVEIEKARTSYFQNLLLLKAIKQAACEDNSELSQIIPKVRTIIKAEDISKYNLGEQNQESLNILGLRDWHNIFSSVTLSYCEKIKFSFVVEERLLSNCSHINKLECKKGKINELFTVFIID